MIPNTNELFHPKGFFAALWPYRFSAMALGHCNAASKKLRAIYAVFAVFGSLLISPILGYSLHERMIRNRGSGVQAVIAYFGFWVQIISSPMHVLAWFFVGHSCFTEVVASLTLVDRELEEMSGKKVNLKTTVIRQILCIILPVLLVIMLIVCHLSLKPELLSWWMILETSAGHYSGMVNIILISFFGNMVRFIGDRYALVNSALQQIGSSVQRESDHDVSSLVFDDVTLTKKLRVIHRKLFFESQKIMKGFEIQAFTCVLASFAYTVYDLYMEFKIDTPPLGNWVVHRILIPVIAILYDFAVVVYAAYCCQRTVQEANGTTKILNSLTTGSEDLRLEVSSFSYQLMHYQLGFSPLGFFRMDLALVQSMFGSIATYLVILVQMEPVPAKSVKNTTAS